MSLLLPPTKRRSHSSELNMLQVTLGFRTIRQRDYQVVAPSDGSEVMTTEYVLAVTR